MSLQILYDNWQKAKRNTSSALKQWNEKNIELSKYTHAKPYKLVKQVKAYHKHYDNMKKQEKDAEILYLKCKDASKLQYNDIQPKRKNVPPKLKLEPELDLKPPPK
ncbi:6210_t:CDS:1 [Scutellospora calospora]|uniref:6210_t:CDS:1 n=1 Tax=Scutellospora calospora TaxID=85575 RepID=A0ACA9LK17_9GLOM|nr:6210_t:CDS:1 [Scutellospora calospora]